MDMPVGGEFIDGRRLPELVFAQYGGFLKKLYRIIDSSSRHMETIALKSMVKGLYVEMAIHGQYPAENSEPFGRLPEFSSGEKAPELRFYCIFFHK